jgi:hypothetical protein
MPVSILWIEKKPNGALSLVREIPELSLKIEIE